MPALRSSNALKCFVESLNSSRLCSERYFCMAVRLLWGVVLNVVIRGLFAYELKGFLMGQSLYIIYLCKSDPFRPACVASFRDKKLILVWF